MEKIKQKRKSAAIFLLNCIILQTLFLSAFEMVQAQGTQVDIGMELLETPLSIEVGVQDGSGTLQPGYLAASLVPGDSRQFTAYAHFAGDIVREITFNNSSPNITTWRSLDESVATVNPSSGMVTAVGAPGTFTEIIADYGGGSCFFDNGDPCSGRNTITVEAPNAITISPPTATINVGETQEYTAVASFLPDHNHADVDVTALATWTLSPASVATVSFVYDSIARKEKATAITAGEAYIDATFLGVTGGSVLGVNMTLPTSISITPQTADIQPAQQAQFTAYAYYSDGSSQEVTTLATWGSSNSAVASIGIHTGTCTGNSLGSAVISVDYQGAHNSASVTVFIPADTGSGGSSGSPQGSPPAETPPAETPPAETPPAETPPAETPPAETPPAETPPAETPPGETPPAETPPAETPPAETPPAETPPAETPPGETPPGETPPVQGAETPIPQPEYFPAPPPPPGEEQLGITVTGQVTGQVPGQVSAVYTPPYIAPELSVSRADIVAYIIQYFNLETSKHDLLKACTDSKPDCLAMFTSLSNYKEIVIDGKKFLAWLRPLINTARAADTAFDLSGLQLFPDVPPELPNSYYINLATILGITQGYYQEPNSPFKPDKIITRMEAMKVILGATDLMKWLYYDELETKLGGPQGVLTQKTPFYDVVPSPTKMWWYPRYLNLACQTQMIDCTEGTKFRPDDYITKDEVKLMLGSLKEKIESGQKFAEVPYAIATDGVGFSDNVEKYSDPLAPDAAPENKTAFVEWQTRYKITTIDPLKDSDFDGVPDVMEYQFGTNPLIADTDGDGYSDAAEIFDMGTDPLVPNKSAEVQDHVKIVNIKDGQLIATSKPMIKGFAPVNSIVRIVLADNFGHEKILGDASVSDNNVFIFQVPDPLRDGKYILMARALQMSKKQILQSAPVHIEINSKLNVPAPIPKKISDQEITTDVLLKNVRVEIVDKRPVIYGQTEFGNKVVAHWKSIVTTSALIADSLGGEFAIMAPAALAVGDHEVYVTSSRAKDNAQSETVKVLFRVNPSTEEAGLEAAQLKGAVEKGLARFMPVSVARFVSRNWVLVLLMGFVLVAIAGTSIYLLLSGKKKK